MTNELQSLPVDDAASTGTLSQFERHEQIVGLAVLNGRVDVGNLAERFDVTTETIRRDLGSLQDKRVLRRVHGGAVPWQRWRYEPSLTVRGSHNAEEKHRIAKRALEELPGEGSILIDSGSTAAHLASLFPRDRKFTVVTNSIPVAQMLATNEQVDVIMIGGALKKNTLALVDSSGVEALETMVVDLAFLGTDGVSPERGFTTPYRDEVAIKRAMMSSARRGVMLLDHSKVGNDHLHRIATVAEIDTIITGAEVQDSDVAALQELGPLVVRA
jgi:DeoR family fructose operon transcriptional repressor